jgi:hypothetical protein
MKRLLQLVPGIGLIVVGLLLINASYPASAVPIPIPMVPNPITIVNNDDDSTQGFRIYQGTYCGGSSRVLYPGTTSQAWVSDVNSMRFTQDARVAVKYKDGRLIKLWGVEASSASKCYRTMTDQRLYEVLVGPGVNAGLDPYT